LDAAAVSVHAAPIVRLAADRVSPNHVDPERQHRPLTPAGSAQSKLALASLTTTNPRIG